MTTLALSALFALLLWWASTGIVLYLDRRPRPTHARSLRGASIVGALARLGPALGAIVISRRSTRYSGPRLACISNRPGGSSTTSPSLR